MDETLNEVRPFADLATHEPFSVLSFSRRELCLWQRSSVICPSGKITAYRSPSFPQTSHSYNSSVFLTNYFHPSKVNDCRGASLWEHPLPGKQVVPYLAVQIEPQVDLRCLNR